MKAMKDEIYVCSIESWINEYLPSRLFKNHQADLLKHLIESGLLRTRSTSGNDTNRCWKGYPRRGTEDDVINYFTCICDAIEQYCTGKGLNVTCQLANSSRCKLHCETPGEDQKVDGLFMLPPEGAPLAMSRSPPLEFVRSLGNFEVKMDDNVELEYNVRRILLISPHTLLIAVLEQGESSFACVSSI
jgi:hypothetical protein